MSEARNLPRKFPERCCHSATAGRAPSGSKKIIYSQTVSLREWSTSSHRTCIFHCTHEVAPRPFLLWRKYQQATVLLAMLRGDCEACTAVFGSEAF